MWCVCFTGCTASVVIRSEPEQASVYYEGKKIGETPCAIDVDFWKEYVTLRLEKEGYVSQDNFIMRRFLDGKGSFLTLGWPVDIRYRLMNKEEADRRKRWRIME